MLQPTKYAANTTDKPSTLVLRKADLNAAVVSLTQAASVEAARSVAMVAMSALWNNRLQLLGATPSAFPLPQYLGATARLSDKVAAAAFAVGESLSQLAPEDALYEIGHLYTTSLPAAHRSEFGIFYTPPLLARRLVDHASSAGMNWIHGKAISPSCGGGQFLVEDALRMTKALKKTDAAIAVASISARLRGWDIDPFACWLTQASVEFVILELVAKSGRRLGPIAECRDSLRSDSADHEGQFDLVNENPAFGKIKDAPELRHRFARSLYGHPNLYGMFADLSLRLAKPKTGLVALLTPTSYFGGEYFKALRRTILEESRPVALDIVESRVDVFPDVLQEVALSVFRKGTTTRRLGRCSIVHAEFEGLRVENAGLFRPPSNKESPWIIARRTEDAPLVRALHKMSTRLCDWGYTVSTGPLVWNRAAEVGRLHDQPGAGRYPVIWAEAISPDGRLALRADRRDHLGYYEATEGKQGRKDANLVSAPCYLLQRTTAKEQARRLIGAPMSASFIAKFGSVAVENHLNMVKAACPKTAVSFRVLAAFMASAAADRVMRCINGSVAVSASEIEAMPLPSVSQIKKAFETADFEAALAKIYGLRLNG